MKIVKNVKRLREKRSITQKALAAKVDAHRVYLAIETATKAPLLDILERLDNALKVKAGRC